MEGQTEQLQHKKNEEEEIRRFLQIIQKGLKKYSLHQLNNTIDNVVNVDEKNHSINCVFSVIKEVYGVNENTMKTKKREHYIVEARQMTYCLLHFDLQLPIRYISGTIFKNWTNSVQIAINKMKNADENHPEDKKFLIKYKEVQSKLNEYIKK